MCKLIVNIFVFSTVILFLVSCKGKDSEVPEPSGFWEDYIPFTAIYNPLQLPFTSDYQSTPQVIGEVIMSEASGLGYSQRNPGYVWSHNDAGNPPFLFLIDASTGEIVCRYRINGVSNTDWEDIEVSTGPDSLKSYIYLADTGDNNEGRTNYSVYRFEEPEYNPANYGLTVNLEDVQVDRLRFIYPDGSHDTEAMFVDPASLDIYLVTKRGVVSKAYVLPYPQNVDALSISFIVGEFGFREASAASMSINGERLLIKNRQQIFYWKRHSGESTWSMLARTPDRAPYVVEPQGEAICFDLENNYYTLSEELNSTIVPELFKYLVVE